MHIKTSEQESFKIGFGEYTCNWGVHMAGLYETEEEKDRIIYGFLKQGFDDKDLLLYCPCDDEHEDFKVKFSQHCPDCKDSLNDQDKLNIFHTKDLYYPDGEFSPISMDKGLSNFYSASQKNGHRNIRATAEMSWALEAVPGVEHLMAYESRLNYFIPEKPWVSICLYDINKFSGKLLMNVLRTHPFTISGGIISQNPYYVCPDQWLKEHAPEFLPENLK